MKEGQRLTKELKALDKELAEGNPVDLSRINSILSQLANVGELGKNMNLKGVSNEFHRRMQALIKKVDDDIHNEEFFIIEGGAVRRRM